MFENNESPSQGLTQLSQSSKNTVEEDFLTLTPRATIQGLKDCKEVRIFFFYFLSNFVVHNNLFINLFYIERSPLTYCLE